MENDDSNQETVQTNNIPGYDSINEFSQRGLTAVVQATRSSNELPVGDDYDFYSTYPAVRDVMDIEGRRILSLIQRIIRYQDVKGNIGPGTNIDLEDRFDVLMDTNDQILEKVGSLLDEASGIKKQETKLVIATTPNLKPSTSWNRTQTVENAGKSASNAYKLLTARNIQRPQLRFQSKIDNSSHPFKPIIKEKPNALKTLEESLALPATVTIDESEQPEFVHPHPYAFELEAFSIDIDAMLKRRSPEEPKTLSETPLTMVNTEALLKDLLSDLRKEKEIAIDLEHHSYRSFQGLTCLMQLSTRSKDYIIDTLELRENMHILNEVFTDPKITKVLHGADSDVMWLQRDLGLYLVNLFDTGQAARVLKLSRFSLAHLLMVYLRKEADKQFQLADWRIRPLPEELINYAREDTHYLLYIYDVMSNQLIDGGNEQGNLLLSVYNRSKIVASQVYSKPIFKEDYYVEIYQKSKKVFNNRQLSALKCLCEWRDQMARTEDESYGYVLPNHMLLQIAEILPREWQGVLACCNPIPPLVRQSLPEIHKLILQAREMPLNKVEKQSVSKPSVSEHPKYDPDSLLNCRHDMTRHDEVIAEIEKSISETGVIAGQSTVALENNSSGITFKSMPIISAFSPSNKQRPSKVTKKLVDQIRNGFSNPFIKYFPKELTKIEKPPAAIPKWRLKASTHQKKSPSEQGKDGKPDLDTFEPEFVPPTKKPKMSVNLLSASSKPSSFSNANNNQGGNSSSCSGGSSSIFRVPAPVSGGSGSAVMGDKETDVKDKKTKPEPKTIKQEALQIKKAKKKKEKRQKMKEKLKEQGKNETEALETESSSSQSQSQLGSVLESSETQEDGSRKKKKKKKLSINDIGKNFAAFNYDEAETKLKKEWKTMKRVDVFSPNLPNRNKSKGKKGDKSSFKKDKKRKARKEKPEEGN